MTARHEHNGEQTLGFTEKLLMRAFGRPQGLLGRIGGILLARGKKEFTDWVVGLLDVQAADRVLEVGFGPGLGIEILAKLMPSGQIDGIDYSQIMVQQATARNHTLIETGRIHLRYGSVEQLPFADASFDKGLSINSLQVWPDALAGLREIRRVMRPRGALALGFTHVARVEADTVSPLLSAAGFSDVRHQRHEQGICVLATV